MVQLTAKQSDIIHSDEANERQVREMHVLSIYVTPKHSPAASSLLLGALPK